MRGIQCRLSDAAVGTTCCDRQTAHRVKLHTLVTMKLNVVKIVKRGSRARRSISAKGRRGEGGMREGERKDRLVGTASPGGVLKISPRSCTPRLITCSDACTGDFTVKCLLYIKQVCLSKPDWGFLENTQQLPVLEQISRPVQSVCSGYLWVQCDLCTKYLLVVMVITITMIAIIMRIRSLRDRVWFWLMDISLVKLCDNNNNNNNNKQNTA